MPKPSRRWLFTRRQLDRDLNPHQVAVDLALKEHMDYRCDVICWLIQLSLGAAHPGPPPRPVPWNPILKPRRQPPPN